ncbi:OprO/OprP family phosphate-selective porin [Crateriforma conspicua]|uniref:OprO/OprP family phosphate-selective porin n=1 Tax=Crateriforma conspicua TaxID=2527996 RepID=UPI0011897C76|nr:porin [Crateriforma conspicua]QDV63739.1 Phosphate-selective porin O and P [Crateriforma conspicua]
MNHSLKASALASALAGILGFTPTLSADQFVLAQPVLSDVETGQPHSDFAPRADEPSLIEADGEGESSELFDAPENEAAADETAATIEELTEKLEALQSDWDDFQEGLDKKAAAAKKKPSTSINGRVHIDNWNFAETDPGINIIENGDPNHDPEDRWTFRRIRLELKGDVPGDMFWRMQIDFNNPSTPEIKDAYIGWAALPGNNRLILGNQKRPLGLDHLNSSRFNVFAERPLAVESFNEDARRFGLAMYGHNDEESIGWAYGIYNLENINTSGRFIGDALQMGGYARIWASPWYDETSGGRGYWHLGLAGAVAKPDGDGETDLDDNNNEGRFRTRPLARSSERWLNTGRIEGADWYEVVAFESIFNVGSLQITGEYFLTPMQRDNVAIDDDLFFHGGYVYVSYFLTGEFNPYKRSNGVLDRVKPFENFFLVDRCRGGCGWGLGAFQVAARYDHLDLSDSNIQGGVADMATLGFNWHWTAYSKVQTNLIWGNIEDNAAAAPYDGGDFMIWGMRYMVDF